MYAIRPPAVLVHESVAGNPAYRERVKRFVSALAQPCPVEVYNDDQIPSLLRDRRILDRRVPMGTLRKVEDPVILFNTFRFGDEACALKRAEDLKAQNLPCPQEILGLGAFNWANYNLEGDPNRAHKVCRPCWRIHLQSGCLHRCAYCPLGGLLVAMVNVDEYCTQLSRIIERHPWQQTYLLDDDADPPALEPELGCLDELIEFFGSLSDRYLVIHTKTWNTAWLRGLKHNGHTILVWSLSGPSQSRHIEPNSGDTAQRIEAARIAEEAGYPIRYKFKPIIPVRNWRQEARETVEMALTSTHPDLVSLCCFMWMDMDEMKRRLAPVLELIDPDCLRKAEEARGKSDNPLTQPFPDEVRAEIYTHYLSEIRRIAPSLPVSLSTESWHMWSRLGPALGMTATNYVCGCGPQSVPGRRLLSDHPFRVAVRKDGGRIPCVYPPFEPRCMSEGRPTQ